ncbi:MAG: cytochrome c [Acidimicrobiia bacterium]
MSEAPNSLFIVLAAAQQGVTSTDGGFGIGAVVLILVMVALLAWLAYLFVNSRRSRSATGERLPLNQTPYISDDELENVHTTRVLRAAVIAAAGIAILLPWYAFNEPNRQAEAIETLSELDIEEGDKWFHQFECFACHGPDLGGGVVQFVEPRSGVESDWLVPSLNDVLYRFDESEVEFVVEYGRLGTPMPANGLLGGGAMTSQEIDQVIAYIRSRQIPQADVLAKTEQRVGAAVLQVETGEAATQVRINRQQTRIDDVTDAKAIIEVTGGLIDEMLDLMGGAGTCTPESAKLALTTCDEPGADSDRDGLTDGIEPRLTEIADISHQHLTELAFNLDGTANHIQQKAYDIAFDPTNGFTNTDDAGLPVPDLDAADRMLETLRGDVLLIQIKADKEDDFLKPLIEGLEFLNESAELMLWSVDFDEVAAAMSEQAGEPVSIEDATRAVGLFNSTCARCHTGGYSAGSTFEVGAGRGAWAPAINDGRTLVQFPVLEDHVKFVIDGSDNAQNYGVNGIGTGRMPGWGASLTADDILLIALYERTL